jgi:hypothetical protein
MTKTEKSGLFISGGQLLFFTEIEDITFDAIERLSYAFSDFSKTLLLEKRLDLLLVLLNSHEDLDDELKLEYTSVIDNVKKISDKRNLIVHNSVKLTITSDLNGTVLSAGGIVSSVRNEKKKMDLRELVEFLDEAEDCHIRLYESRNNANKQLRNAQEVRRKRELRRRSALARRARQEIDNAS